MERLNVVFTGGGTGGHLYPAIAIAQALGERANVTFVGAADRLEAKIVPNAGYPLVTVRARPLVRKPSLDQIATIFANLAGMAQAMRALARLHPDLVIATGGYVCFPVVLAAKLLRLPVALLEPNAHPGLTNRLLAPLVDEVWGAFAIADARFVGKYQHTGIPVRASLRSLPSREEAVQRLGLSPQRRTLLAVGGSQGARSINDALTSLVTTGGLPDGWQLVHVTGEKEYDRVKSALRQAQGDSGAQGDREAQGDSEAATWHPELHCHPELVEGAALRPYLTDMADAYAAADLVLARAGASTLAELAATGKPAILVPYPHAAEDHQRANAAGVAELGAAVIVDDRELAAGKLRGILAGVTQPGRLAALQAAAQRGPASDPVTTILARVESLTARKKQP